MKLGAKVAYNTIIQLISKILATGLALVAVAIITRYLGQTGYGEFTTAVTFISFFAIIADLGLTLVTVQMISQGGADQDKILGNLLGLRLISAFLFIGLAPISVLFFPYSVNIKIAVLISTVSYISIALNQIMVGLFQKHLRLDKVSIAEVLSRIILVAATFAAVELNTGLAGIVSATAVASVVNFLLLYLFSRRLATIKLQFDLAYWRKIITRSWPLAVTIVLNLIYLKADTLFLSLIPRPSNIGIIAEVGLYGAAYKVIDVVITFPFMFAGIILPILTYRWSKKDADGYKIVLQKSIDIMILMAIPMLVGTQMLSREIMVFVAGEEFIASGAILQILILAAALIYISVMFSHAVIAINKQKNIIKAYLFTAITSVIAYLLVIPKFSYFGAAWATVYSELAVTVAAIYIAWKYSRFTPKLGIIFKSGAASLGMALAIWLASNYLQIHLLFNILIAIIVYFVLILLFKAINKQELKNLLKK